MLRCLRLRRFFAYKNVVKVASKAYVAACCLLIPLQLLNQALHVRQPSIVKIVTVSTFKSSVRARTKLNQNRFSLTGRIPTRSRADVFHFPERQPLFPSVFLSPGAQSWLHIILHVLQEFNWRHFFQRICARLQAAPRARKLRCETRGENDERESAARLIIHSPRALGTLHRAQGTHEGFNPQLNTAVCIRKVRVGEYERAHVHVTCFLSLLHAAEYRSIDAFRG